MEPSSTGGEKVRAPASALGRQLREVIAALDAAGVSHALIGGLALVSHGIERATRDIDLLVAAEHAHLVEGEMTRLGYRQVHRDANAGNYLRGHERVDFLYASRPIARRLLESAIRVDGALGSLRAVRAEGIIGFKMQALANDPGRPYDLADIRALVRRHRDALDLSEVREYFRLFDRESLLDEILAEAS